MADISKPFIEQFLDELIKKAWFPEDSASLLKRDLRPILQERIMLYIYKELEESQADEVTRLFKAEKYNEINAFLRECIPNYDNFIMEIYAQFEDEYLENFEEEK